MILLVLSTLGVALLSERQATDRPTDRYGAIPAWLLLDGCMEYGLTPIEASRLRERFVAYRDRLVAFMCRCHYTDTDAEACRAKLDRYWAYQVDGLPDPDALSACEAWLAAHSGECAYVPRECLCSQLSTTAATLDTGYGRLERMAPRPLPWRPRC